MLDGDFLTVDETVADAFALKTSSGVVVLTVEDGGALDQATVRVGDVIVAVDGNAISTLDELEDYLSGLAAGDTVTFTVNRGGEEVELTVTLSEAADDASATQASYDSDSGDEEEDEDYSLAGEDAISLYWIGSHLYIVIPIILLILLVVGILIGLMLRRRKKEQEDGGSEAAVDDGFWEGDGE